VGAYKQATLNAKDAKAKATRMGKLATAYAKESPTPPTWEDVDSQLLWRLIWSCNNDGIAVMFGTTQKQDSLSLTIWEGIEKVKLYAQTPEEMTGHIIEMLQRLGEL
jgi:hypothetical protein